jgi:hypothetical protein
MTNTSDEKRQRAARMPRASAPAATQGQLEVLWDSPFDRLCYLLTATNLGIKHPARYAALLKELAEGTGCTEDELVAHGMKVRAVLYFAEENLARQGLLGSLVGGQKYLYRLAPVKPAF